MKNQIESFPVHSLKMHWLGEQVEAQVPSPNNSNRLCLLHEPVFHWCQISHWGGNCFYDPHDMYRHFSMIGLDPFLTPSLWSNPLGSSCQEMWICFVANWKCHIGQVFFSRYRRKLYLSMANSRLIYDIIMHNYDNLFHLSSKPCH